MMPNLRQLAYVAEAARCCSIAGAAASLNISPSSILLAIDKLEEEFDIQIFVRRRAKGLTTTTAGERVIARVIRLLDEVMEFEADLGGQGQEVAGELQIGCFASISPHTVPQIIRNLALDHPGLSVHLHEGDLVRIQNDLRNGTVDILLTYDAGMTGEFEIESLMSVPPHAVLAADDDLARQDRVSIRDLAERPLFLLNLPESSNYVLSLFDQFGYRPRVVHRTESYEMIRSSVAAGLGVAVQNMRPLIDVSYGGLEVVCKPIVESVRDPHIVLAWRRGGLVSRRAEIFARYCRAFFNSPAAQNLVVP